MSGEEKNQYDEIVEDISSGAKALQEVGKIGLWSRLFGKSFDIIGDALAEYLDKKISKKEEENLQSHIAYVKDIIIIDSSIEIDLPKIGALLEWIDGAKNISEKKFPETARLWREALKKLLNDNFDLLRSLESIRPETIEKYKKDQNISFDDAVIFQKMNLGKIKKPERAGLIQTEKGAILIGKILAVYLLFAVLAALFFSKVINLQDSGNNIMTFLLLVVVISPLIYMSLYVSDKINSKFIKTKIKTLCMFWCTPKGLYVFSQIFGEINKIYIEIDSDHEEEIKEYLK